MSLQYCHKGTEMNTFKFGLGAVCMAAVALSATGASARSALITDAQYLQSQRCQALMSSSALGRQDTHAVDAFLRTQGAARDQATYERGQAAHDNAAVQARNASAGRRAELIAERDGVCRSVMSGVTVAGGGGQGPAAH